jgi:hypothetical protein
MASLQACNKQPMRSVELIPWMHQQTRDFQKSKQSIPVTKARKCPRDWSHDKNNGAVTEWSFVNWTRVCQNKTKKGLNHHLDSADIGTGTLFFSRTETCYFKVSGRIEIIYTCTYYLVFICANVQGKIRLYVAYANVREMEICIYLKRET